jgi:thiamine biosynthesis lipoprotein
VKLWGFQGGTPSLPSEEEIAGARALVGSEKIIWGEHSPRIGLPPGMELDLAGIAKGYAVDRCAMILRSYGVTSALVNLGGNMYAIGAPPGKESWTIGIRDPVATDAVIGSFSLRDAAVATSGNYENFVEIDGKRYGHIIDPRTGYPVDHVLSVTVVASTALEADALSTGFFVLGPDKAAEALDGLPGVRALFLMPDGDGTGFTPRPIGGFEARYEPLEER